MIILHILFQVNSNILQMEFLIKYYKRKRYNHILSLVFPLETPVFSSDKTLTPKFMRDNIKYTVSKG